MRQNSRSSACDVPTTLLAEDDEDEDNVVEEEEEEGAFIKIGGFENVAIELVEVVEVVFVEGSSFRCLL